MTRFEPSASDKPLHVVHLCGEIIVYADSVEYIMTPDAAEETSRRLASVAALARLQAVA